MDEEKMKNLRRIIGFHAFLLSALAEARHGVTDNNPPTRVMTTNRRATIADGDAVVTANQLTIGIAAIIIITLS